MHSDIHGFIFDLDGVLVDIARYHFQAEADTVIRGFSGIMPETILARFSLFDHERNFA